MQQESSNNFIQNVFIYNIKTTFFIGIIILLEHLQILNVVLFEII